MTVESSIAFPIADGLSYANQLYVKHREYVLITGATKAGKTQIMSYFFIFNVLLYSFRNQDKYKVHYLYFLLEESIEDVFCRFTTYILNSVFGIRIDYDTLTSSTEKNKLPDDVLAIIESSEFKAYMQFFEDHVQFETNSFTSDQIEQALDSYARQFGTITMRKVKQKTSVGYVTSDTYENDSYTSNSKDINHIVVLDNFNNIQLTDYEYNLNEAISNVSKLFVKGKNMFHFTFVAAIQQVDSETHSLSAVNNGNILATKAGIKDSKQPGNDCTQLWGINNPGEFDQLSSFKSYNLNKFHRNYFRCLEVIFCRKRKGKKFFNFFFDGATTSYQLLPPPDSEEMNDYYNKVEQIDKINNSNIQN